MFGDQDSFDELVDYALKSFPRSLEQIEAALSRHDLDDARRLAHKLKGGAVNVRFNRLGELAETLEKLPGADAQEFSALAAALRQEFEGLELELLGKDGK